MRYSVLKITSALLYYIDSLTPTHINYKVRKNDKTEKRVFILDWVEFTTLKSDELFEIKETEKYKIKSLDLSDKFFADIQEVSINDKVFAVIKSKPKQPNLDKKLLRVKIDNSFLYECSLLHKINEFMQCYNLQFKYYNRIDIACDFQKFDSENDFYTVVEKLFTHEYRFKGYKSKKYCKQSANYGIVPHSQSDELCLLERGKKITGLMIGSRRSDNHAKIYNKSLEMKTKTYKPYIQKLWELNGIDTNKDVYRFEISLKRNRKKAIIETFDDGEILDIYNDVNAINSVVKLFTVFYKNYYSIVQDDNIRFDRCTPVNLFNDIIDHDVNIKSINVEKSNRYVKGVINRMVKEYNTIYKYYWRKTDAENLLMLISEMVQKYYLMDWFNWLHDTIKLPNTMRKKMYFEIDELPFKSGLYGRRQQTEKEIKINELRHEIRNNLNQFDLQQVINKNNLENQIKNLIDHENLDN